MFCFLFICLIIKLNNLYLDILANSILLTFLAFVSYEHDIILSKVYMLSSLLLNAILIYSVYKLCASLLNLCGDFNLIS